MRIGFWRVKPTGFGTDHRTLECYIGKLIIVIFVKHVLFGNLRVIQVDNDKNSELIESAQLFQL